MTEKTLKIAALRNAMDTAQASLDDVIKVLVALEDAFPTPAPPPIEQMKRHFGDVAQNWTIAHSYADRALRGL